jgi:glycosyltransferase involved in cell wall biosynthesis
MNRQKELEQNLIQDKTLAIVVPCYNEEEMLPLTIDTLLTFINKLVTENICSNQSFIVFIDDGSRDNTWQLIEAAALNSSGRICGLRLACNTPSTKFLPP